LNTVNSHYIPVGYYNKYKNNKYYPECNVFLWYITVLMENSLILPEFGHFSTARLEISIMVIICCLTQEFTAVRFFVSLASALWRPSLWIMCRLKELRGDQ